MALVLDGTSGITNPGFENLSGNVSTPTGTVTAATFIGNGASLTGIAGGFSNMQVFTSPGTFTTPASTTKIKVTVVGSGNSGGPGGTTLPGGGGGGGGAAIYVGPVTVSTPYAVTVGAAGGNTSSFSTLASATGGSTGSSNATTGIGGLGSAGTISIQGGAGAYQTGGSSYLGGGGAAPSKTGGNYGGGGSGGTSNPSPASPVTLPGTGASGVVVVEY